MADPDTKVSAMPAAVPDNAKLSQPARDIVKMTVSRIPEDVIKSYINNSPTVFNLSADNIINLQGVGVSSAVTASMLMHDKSVRDNAPVLQPQMPGQPQMPQPNAPYPGMPDQGAVNPPIDSQTVYDYSTLSPYGDWNYVADYGWYWQPYGWLGYDYYPWGYLRFGRWCNFSGRGWCWLPGSHFRAGAGFTGGHHSFGGTSGGGGRGTVGAGNFWHGSVGGARPAPVRHSAGVSHAMSGAHSVRSASFGASHFSGGGSHFSSGGGGGHSSGGGHSGGGHR